MAQRQEEIDSLKSIVSLHKQFSDESVRVSPEIKGTVSVGEGYRVGADGSVGGGQRPEH